MLYSSGRPVCPVNTFDRYSCPYHSRGFCTLENPEEECDEFADWLDSDTAIYESEEDW